jgi:hypothetical protein
MHKQFIAVFGNGAWRLFAVGVLCGTVLTAVVGGAFIWWKSDADGASVRSSQDYDACLVEKYGNKVACDALMRMLNRERVAERAMKEKAATLLAAGFSKREVVEWARKQGFVSSQLSDAVGISLEDLQGNKY